MLLAESILHNIIILFHIIYIYLRFKIIGLKRQFLVVYMMFNSLLFKKKIYLIFPDKTIDFISQINSN